MRTETFAPPGMPLSLRLEPNARGRDLVVGDLHGRFDTLRRARAGLEVDERDRLFSLGEASGKRAHFEWSASARRIVAKKSSFSAK